MKYVTLCDLSETIRKNIWKIPRDIDFIIGVPRSGMICASIISDHLNVPLIDVNSFLSGLEPTGGSRIKYFNENHKKTNRVLVVEDTVFNGTSINNVKAKLADNKELEFIYLCVYLEGRESNNHVDIYLEDLRPYTNNFTTCVLYEWNIFQHYKSQMSGWLFDMDGVLCVNPPDERNEAEYIEYIKNAIPLFLPRAEIGGIMTYRLIKNLDITQKWLSDNGVHYGKLYMFKANTWEERNASGITPEVYKGEFFKDNDRYSLFVESDDHQAQRIHEISKKPVFCVETNKLYQ